MSISSPTGGAPRSDRHSVSHQAPFSRYAGGSSLMAGSLFIVAQVMMWPFDQALNLATAQNVVFQSAKVVLLIGFCFLMFALIGIHGLQANRAGRLGAFAAGLAIVGTMMLAGDLWFETFAVEWLAGGPTPQVLTSTPSTLFALGAIASYLLFAAGWALFGVASLRARVFPAVISILIVFGGLAGFSALLAPYGIPLGVAVAALGGWILARARQER
jgi:hypothetical protein